MTIQKQEEKKESGVSASIVAEYLKNHVNFFDEHPEVLRELEIPHQTGGAVSLIERQVQVLRQDTRQLRQRIRDLVEIAKDNDQLMAKLHHVSTELVSAQNLDEYLQVLNESLLHDFAADAVSIRLLDAILGAPEASRDELVPAGHEAWQLFESILTRGKPVCGRFNRQQLEFMFPGKEDDMKSVAVVPLHSKGRMGMFCVGSADPNRFRAGMSTTFLAYLGEMASVVLNRFRG